MKQTKVIKPPARQATPSKPSTADLLRMIDVWTDEYYSLIGPVKHAQRRSELIRLIYKAHEIQGLPTPFLGQQRAAPKGAGMPLNGASGAYAGL